MTVPHVLVTRFFQLVDKRQFAEAERELQRIKQKMRENEWNKGYYMALFGILISTKTNNDEYLFLPKLDRNDRKALQECRREFLKHVTSRLSSSYDKGFFSAWADYTRILLKTLKTNKKTEKTKKQEASDRKLKTKKSFTVSNVRKAKSQTNIFQFLSLQSKQSVKENPKNNP